MKVKTTIQTGHQSNIFSAKYLPNTNDRHIVSCCGDGSIIFTDVERPYTSLNNLFNCHFGTTYDLVTIPNDPHTFLSCGEDATVRWFDLRQKSCCWNLGSCKEDVLINFICPVTAISINQITPYLLAAGCADNNAYVFDLRMLNTKKSTSSEDYEISSIIKRFKVPFVDRRNYRITSICFSPDGQEILISYTWDFIYLFNINDEGVTTKVFKEKATVSNFNSSNKPSVKRVRVRGDWSDTGPKARPEKERSVQLVDEGDNSMSLDHSMRSGLILRLSNLMTRLYNADRERRTRSIISSIISSNNAADRPSGQPPSVNSNRSLNGNQSEQNKTTNNNASLNEPSISSDKKQTNNDKETNKRVKSTSSNRKILQRKKLALRKSKSTNVKSAPEGTSSCDQLTSNCSTSAQSQQTSNQNPGDNLFFIDLEDTSDVALDEETDMQNLTDSDEDQSFDEVDGETVSRGVGDEPHDDNSNDINNSSESTANTGTYRGRLYRSLNDVFKRFQAKNEKWTRMPSPLYRQKYNGHRNTRTTIKKATFWGNKFIMSGSDCGHIFVWDRQTAELVMIMEADTHVVNCLQPHPYDPILASSGIDNDIKLWHPISVDTLFDKEKAKEIIRVNEAMLEESKDTIIVPASVFVRIMSSIISIRNRERESEGSSAEPSHS